MHLLLYFLLLPILFCAQRSHAQNPAEKKLELTFIDTMRGTLLPKVSVDIFYECPERLLKKNKKFTEHLYITNGKLSKTLEPGCTAYMIVGWDTYFFKRIDISPSSPLWKGESIIYLKKRAKVRLKKVM